MTDSQGFFILSSHLQALGGDYSDREWFILPRNDVKNTLYISRTVVSRITGKPAIPLSRRINNPDGSFAGVVHASLDTTYFESVYQSLELQNKDILSLNGFDGFVRYRQSDNQSVSGQEVGNGEIVKRVLATRQGIVVSPSVLDGVERINAYRALQDYPLFVIVGFSTDNVLKPIEERKKHYVFYGLVAISIIGITCLLMIDRKRREQAEANRILKQAKINEVLREITETALLSVSLGHLYASIHSLVMKVLPAKNFYISLLDVEHNEIYRPYCIDETGTVPHRRPVDQGLTEYFMRQEKAKHVTPTLFEQLKTCGELTLYNSAIFECIGAPLRYSKGKAFGAITLFVEEDPVSFKGEDVELLSIIAGQISMVIERKQAEEVMMHNFEIQTVLREIAEAALKSPSLDALYIAVHQLVRRVLPAENFYISIFDEAQQMMRFPYCKDETESICDRPAGQGLTEFLMRIGQASHFDRADLERMIAKREIVSQMAQCAEWLGAPLFDSQGRPFGAIAMFWTKTIGIYKESDTGLLEIIAAQISQAIDRKRTEQALVESESRYKTVMEQSPEPVFVNDPQSGEIFETNARFKEQFGYDLNINGSLKVFDLFADSVENIASFLARARVTGQLPMQRRVVKHRNGMLIEVERSAKLVRFQGREIMVQTLRDVSDIVRREKEVQREADMATKIQNALLTVSANSDYLDVATIYKPFGFVGGDLFFMDWRYNGSLFRGFLVDTSGHGLATALHAATLHVLLREVNEQDLPLADSMRWLNRRVREFFDDSTFAGAIGFEFDLEMQVLRWVCAGIPELWLATKEYTGVLGKAGMFLGLLPEEQFETHMISIESGDCFYFMTDGLTDQLTDKQKLPMRCYDLMIKKLREYAESDKRRDDATAICIQVRKLLMKSLTNSSDWPRVINFNGYGDYLRFRSGIAAILAEVTSLPHSMQEVAIHEALANAMECRDGVFRQHRARVRFNKFGKRLVVRIKTSRIGFAGNAILRRLRSHPEEMFLFGEDASMGRGIPMMLSIAHRMMYNSEGTELLLAWKLYEE